MGSDGVITKVSLQNFLTYDDVTVYPGPNLNVIIGPNGTGKSSIVCAICLGLGGKPSILGRANDVGDFVKYGCGDARLHIELKKGSKSITISREIRRQGNKSTWYINNESVVYKKIEEVISGLNIQVDNLCGFLPQDRVQDFARMNQQELLVNTQKAVGEPGLFEQFEELKHIRKQFKKYQITFSSVSENLNQEVQRNDRLDADVQNYHQRNKLMEKVELLHKKRKWVAYKECRQQFMQVKQKKDEAAKILEKERKSLKPAENALNTALSDVTKLQRNVKIGGDAMKTNMRDLTTYRNKYETEDEHINEITADLDSKQEQERKRESQMENLRQQLQGITNELQELQDRQEGDVAGEISGVNEQIGTANKLLLQIAEEKETMAHEINSRNYRKQDLQRQVDILQNQMGQRMNALKKNNSQVYEAVRWLRSHTQDFTHKIYEPMVLLINIGDPKDAMYVESHIPKRDMYAFVCEDKADMNKFLGIVREKLKLTISAVHSGANTNREYRPNVNINQIKQYGFRDYLINLFTAPVAITNYLCNMHRMHNIPVGDKKTYTMAQDVIDKTELSDFYTDRNRFVVSRSRYSGEKSTRISEVAPPTLLEKSVDEYRITAARDSISELDAELRRFEERHTAILGSETSALREMEDLRKQRHAIISRRDHKNTLTAKQKAKQEQINRMERMNINIVEEEQMARGKIQKHVWNQLNILRQQQTRLAEIEMMRLNSELGRISLDAAQQSVTKYRQDLADAKQHLQQYEMNVREIETQIAEVKCEAKRLFDVAKEATGVNEKREVPTYYLERFNSLPTSLDGVDEMISEVQAQAECLLSTDPTVVQEFERRQKDIAELKQQAGDLETRMNNLSTQIQGLKETWLPKVEGLLSRVNDNYSRFFSSLDCAGEVSLHKGADEDEFDLYGIKIRVKFRAAEPLMELTPHIQSGGERSVSTILYIMALQELSEVPFRCVDEINQGMDPINERRVFDLVVQTATQASAQYFLLTPKLLPNLEFQENVTVHIINNGTKMVHHKHWSIDKFVKRRTRLQ